MQVIVNDGSGDNHWSRGWAQAFADAIEGPTGARSVEINVSGRSQISMRMRHRGISALCTMNADRASDPVDRAGRYAAWFSSDAQQALFAEAEEHEARPVMVERAAVLAAAGARASGDDLIRGVREVLHTRVAHCKGARPSMKVGMDSTSIVPGLTARSRKDEHPVLRLRAKDFRLTNLSFTPQVDMHLPWQVMEAMSGQPLERFVDHPLVAGCGLFVTDVTTAGGGATGSRPRTSLHLASDPIALEEAARLVDARMNEIRKDRE